MFQSQCWETYLKRYDSLEEYIKAIFAPFQSQCWETYLKREDGEKLVVDAIIVSIPVLGDIPQKVQGLIAYELLDEEFQSQCWETYLKRVELEILSKPAILSSFNPSVGRHTSKGSRNINDEETNDPTSFNPSVGRHTSKDRLRVCVIVKHPARFNPSVGRHTSKGVPSGALAMTSLQSRFSAHNFYLTYKFYFIYSEVAQTVAITGAWVLG